MHDTAANDSQPTERTITKGAGRLALVALALVAGTIVAAEHGGQADAAAQRADAGVAPGVALFVHDAGAPLDVRERGRVTVGGVTRIDLTFESPHGGRVPALVFEPAGPGPHAGMVLAHGMPGHRWTLAGLGEAYARAGAVAITITAPFARPDPPHRAPALFILPLFDERDRLELVQNVVDLRRAIDYLTEHGNVDARAIGFVGHSYGGIAGAILAGVERRIRAFALMAAPAGLPDRFLDENERSTGLLAERPAAQQEAWLATMAALDAKRFVAFAAPADMLFQIARDDRLVRREVADELAAAASVPKEVLYYEADHELVPDAFRDQARWFARRLPIDADAFVPPDLR